MENGNKYRSDQKMTWNSDSMCLNRKDAELVVSHYRASYSTTRFNWLMKQAVSDTPFEECRKVFENYV